MKKIDNKNIKISFIINILIVIMTIAALIISITGFKFMHGYEPSSELPKTQKFSYFTVQSNVFMAMVSLLFAIKEFQILKGTKKEIPSKYYILKMIATIAVALTFIVVFACFSFVTKGGILSLLKNSNLFFHLIIPVISIITYIFFEKTDNIKFKHTIYGLLPTILYEIYYIINIISNLKNGKVSPTYDWYYFLQNGVWTAIIVAPMMIGVTYVITLLIWISNRDNNEKIISNTN